MPRMNYELFQFIEMRGSVTVDEVAKKFGMSKRSTATVLSRFTNYEKDRIKKHYLIYEQDTVRRRRAGRFGPKNVSQGRYRIGPDWWGELKGASIALL